MRLLNGWDDIDLTKSYRERIAAFKENDRAGRPWAVPTANS
jgi:3-isopropylmalate/(R)-2-methylmalate dehydratase small subunit